MSTNPNETPEEAMTRIKDTLDYCEDLNKRVRARAMIFQAGDKETVAEFYGLPVDTFYHFPYKLWSAVSAQWAKDSNHGEYRRMG
jgi:hypothetical protein